MRFGAYRSKKFRRSEADNIRIFQGEENFAEELKTEDFQPMCGEPSCMNKATNKCTCKNPVVYLCDDHVSKHIRIRTDKQHIIDSLIIELNSAQKNEAIEKIKILRKNLQDIKMNFLNYSKDLVKLIENELKSSLNQIHNLEQSLPIFFFTSPMSKKEYNFIKNYKIECSSIDLSNCFKSIKEVFDVNFERKQNFNDLYFIGSDDSLSKLNLEKLKISDIEVPNYLFNECKTVIRIDKDKVLWHDESRSYNGNIFMFDLINKKRQIIIKNLEFRNYYGYVVTNKLVYRFGGTDSGGNLLNTADVIDIEKKYASQLPFLPRYSSDNTASLISDKIFITGENLNCVYIFDFNHYYKSHLNLNKNRSKFICEEWVVDFKSIYEYQNDKFIQHKLVRVISIDEDVGCCDAVLKKGDFIYIIVVDQDMVYRINLKSKTLESLKALCGCL